MLLTTTAPTQKNSIYLKDKTRPLSFSLSPFHRDPGRLCGLGWGGVLSGLTGQPRSRDTGLPGDGQL